jgi:hypothetical protein
LTLRKIGTTESAEPVAGTRVPPLLTKTTPRSAWFNVVVAIGLMMPLTDTVGLGNLKERAVDLLLQSYEYEFAAPEGGFFSTCFSALRVTRISQVPYQ